MFYTINSSPLLVTRYFFMLTIILSNYQQSPMPLNLSSQGMFRRGVKLVLNPSTAGVQKINMTQSKIGLRSHSEFILVKRTKLAHDVDYWVMHRRTLPLLVPVCYIVHAFSTGFRSAIVSTNLMVIMYSIIKDGKITSYPCLAPAQTQFYCAR